MGRVLGPHGLLSKPKKDLIIIDSSTSEPLSTASLREQAAAAEHHRPYLRRLGKVLAGVPVGALPVS